MRGSHEIAVGILDNQWRGRRYKIIQRHTRDTKRRSGSTIESKGNGGGTIYSGLMSRMTCWLSNYIVTCSLFLLIIRRQLPSPLFNRSRTGSVSRGGSGVRGGLRGSIGIGTRASRRAAATARRHDRGGTTHHIVQGSFGLVAFSGRTTSGTGVRGVLAQTMSEAIIPTSAVGTDTTRWSAVTNSIATTTSQHGHHRRGRRRRTVGRVISRVLGLHLGETALVFF